MGALIELVVWPLVCLSPILAWAWWNWRADRRDAADLRAWREFGEQCDAYDRARGRR